MLSEKLLFTLKEKKLKYPAVDKGGKKTQATSSSKAIGYGKIDLKKMYDQISI
jgi:hypothetical protein